MATTTIISSLLGYKGKVTYGVGTVYCPYVPLTTLKTNEPSVENKVRQLERDMSVCMNLFRRYCGMQLILLMVFITDLVFGLDCRIVFYTLGGALIFPMLGCLILRQKINYKRLDLIMENL